LAYFTADQNHLPGFFATMDNVDLLWRQWKSTKSSELTVLWCWISTLIRVLNLWISIVMITLLTVSEHDLDPAVDTLQLAPGVGR
jgi:hypothetical protein